MSLTGPISTKFSARLRVGFEEQTGSDFPSPTPPVLDHKRHVTFVWALQYIGARGRLSVFGPDSVNSGGANMQQIADWLKKLGLSDYAQRFAENGVSIEALRHLTDQDLKEIGV